MSAVCLLKPYTVDCGKREFVLISLSVTEVDQVFSLKQTHSMQYNDSNNY